MTKAGHGKDVSEDTVLVGDQLYSNVIETVEFPENGLICVADGVGGNNAGEEASAFVLNALAGYQWTDDEATRTKLLDINHQLIGASNKDKSLYHMATTMSGICLKDGVLHIIHVGNTRVYAMQGRYLKLLTSDHTTYNWLKSLGRTEEAENCNKDEITNCFGGGNDKLIEKLYVQSINEAKTMLLTSDGIHEYVSIDDLEDIINSDISNEEKCDAIQRAALQAGSTDDMTVVLVCIQEDV